MLPETKPAMEWIFGQAVQKVSPQRKHARAQGAFVSELMSWADRTGLGRVGTEWEFRIAPPDEIRRPLVPDVAYLSYAKIPYDKPTEADIPRVAPDAVVEVLSPDDRRAYIEEKIRVYLAAGTSVVFVVDTDRRTVTAHHHDDTHVFGEHDNVADDALPGFKLPALALFEEPKPKT